MRVSNASARGALAASVVLMLGLPLAAGAATITADGLICSLSNAIVTANRNANTGGCVAVGPLAIADTSSSATT